MADYWTKILTAGLLAGLLLSQSALSSGFKEWLLGPEETRPMSSESHGSGDDATSRCLSCHDGRNATAIQFRSAGSPPVVHGHKTGNHSMGMNYDQYTAANPTEYRNRSEMQPGIVFENGKVGCLSCHKLKTLSGERLTMASEIESGTVSSCTSSGDLTVGPRKTTLCMACHML